MIDDYRKVCSLGHLLRHGTPRVAEPAQYGSLSSSRQMT